MKKAINPTSGCIEFTFDGLDPIIFDPTKASSANRDYAMRHGFMQRLGDNAAISKSAENGYVVTEAMRREAVMELVEHYRSGSDQWTVKAKARGPAQNPVIAQIAAKLGCTYAEAEAKVAEQMLGELGG